MVGIDNQPELTVGIQIDKDSLILGIIIGAICILVIQKIIKGIVNFIKDKINEQESDE